jgi:hypothetical protein
VLISQLVRYLIRDAGYHEPQNQTKGHPPMPTSLADVKVGRIFIDLNNPRHVPFASEPQAIEYLCKNEGVYPLARDIKRHGLNPLERVALIPVKAKDGTVTGYNMAEGNRRLCALKLLTDPERALADLRKPFQDLAQNWTPITSLPAVIFDSMESARIWLERIHSGPQGGIAAKIGARNKSSGLAAAQKTERRNYF